MGVVSCRGVWLVLCIRTLFEPLSVFHCDNNLSIYLLLFIAAGCLQSSCQVMSGKE